MKTKQQKIKLIVALVIFAIVVVSLILTIKFLNPNSGEEESTSNNEPNLEDIAKEGEGTYLSGLLLMYPEIDKGDITSISIKTKDGQVDFVNKVSDKGTRSLRLKKYPALKCSDTIANNMYSAMCVPLVEYNDNKEFYAFRDVTEQERIEYGVTEDTCTVEYTISYTNEKDEKISHTVYIGEKAYRDETSYYAAVKGRENAVYIIDSTIESIFGGDNEEFYVSPLIYSGTNITDTMFMYEDFAINKFQGDKFKKQLLGIHGTKNVVVNESINVEFDMMWPEKTAGLAADNLYMTNAFATLFVSFGGDKVMVLEPTDEDMEKYGFGKKNEFYIVYAKEYKSTDDPDEVPNSIMYTISEKMDGYFYVYTESLGKKDTIDYIPDSIIRVPESVLSFIEEENVIQWVATNSLESGFFQSIYANENDGKIGVSKMSVYLNNILIANNERISFDDTFNIEYTTKEDGGRKLRVWLDKNKEIEFIDKEDYDTISNRNQFNNFYANLLNYPMPYRFNEMTEEQREAVKADKNNLVFSLHVELNDGTPLTYDYYRIDGSDYVMCEFTDETFKEPTVVFDVKMGHVIIIAQALDQLMSGEIVITK